MIYQTKYFGAIDCDPDELFHFPAGLPGFESEHEFLLIPFEESGGGLYSLQSAVTPALSFFVMDPFVLVADYTPELTAADLQELGVSQWNELSYGVLCSFKSPAEQSTVNLQCPIALHLDTRQAKQIIMDAGRYQMRHPLSSFSQQEETSLC